MTLQQFHDKMINRYNAYWVSYYIPSWSDKTSFDNSPGFGHGTSYHDKRMDQDIVQIDSLGVRTGNESLILEMEIYIEELNVKIHASCKMLGHSLDECLKIIKQITEFIPTCYYSVS